MQEFSKRATQKISKLSEAQIQAIVTEISNENELLDSVFQSVSTGLMVVATDFRLKRANKAALRYLPFSMNPGEPRAESLPVWELLGGGEIARFLRTSLESKKTNVGEEFSVPSGDGVRFLGVSITPFAQNRHLAGSIVLIEDLTEKRAQEILLHRMEAMASLTNIAANVAHEIKNPLGAISVHIQLVQKAVRKRRGSDGKLPDRKFLEGYLDVVNQEIDRLNSIVVNFLTAVRPISARLKLSNPDAIIDELVSFFKVEFDDKKIAVEKRLGGGEKVMIDEKLFREVIVNLAQNSVAAILERRDAAAGAFVGSVRINTFVRDGVYTVLFMDNGIGMDDATARRVFEPYFTTKADGTGLGMAMSYKIIKEFNGNLSVNSERGKGTEFVIQIPVPQKNTVLLTFSGEGR